MTKSKPMRIHKAAFYCNTTAVRPLCGNVTGGAMNFVWSNVTCGHCLKRRPTK